jgi:hypothetical protein
MKYLTAVSLCLMLVSAACVATSQAVSSGGTYQSSWEEATLLSDEFGSQLMVERQNGEVWLIKAKTYCFWTRQYVGKTVMFKWGPVECVIMNDSGQECEFWTQQRRGSY